MFFSKKILRIYKIQIAIFLFLCLFGLFHYIQPSFAYENGNFRQFGVGYQHKTVIPVWLVAIILAILCYTAVVSLLLYT